MKWSKNEIEKVKKMIIDDGLSHPEISNIIGRTSGSIQQKMNRIGIHMPQKQCYENIGCENCGKIFKALISEKRKFCSSKCSTIKNNMLRFGKSNSEKKKCIVCNKKLPSNYNEFCSKKCRYSKLKKFYYDKILNNNYDDIKHSTIERWAKRYVIEKNGENCMKCGWCEIHPVTKKIPVQLNHIDGNSDNNCVDNLEILCPNCHSLTFNYGSLNIGNGRTKRKIERNNRNKKMSIYSNG